MADFIEVIGLWSRANLPFKPIGRDSELAIETQMSANPDFFLGHLKAII